MLDGRLNLNRSGSYSLVVCGGAALNAMQLIQRTTKDVDIVAMMDSSNQLVDPAPLPEELLIAAKEVARHTSIFPKTGSIMVQAVEMEVSSA